VGRPALRTGQSPPVRCAPSCPTADDRPPRRQRVARGLVIWPPRPAAA
jgi:hypothetical protein